LQALERSGVKRVSPKGERFDANFHQAMFEVENVEVPHNTVVEVVQDGYVIGERMLRPAIVGVSRGGPKPVRAPAGEMAGEKQE
jgi:molecular chaperone GrpE